MENPMMKKNPMMSMWLSGANAWMGAGRSFWTVEIQRQQTAMMNEMTKQAINFWTGAWTSAISSDKPKDRR